MSAAMGSLSANINQRKPHVTAREDYPHRSVISPDAGSFGIEQRLSGHHAAHPPPEDVDLYRAADCHLDREIGVGDRFLHRVAVATARHPATDIAADPHGLV